MKIKVGSPKKWAHRARHFVIKQPVQRLIIIAVIAAVGGFAVYRSFALSPLDAPTGAGNLVLELDKGDGTPITDSPQHLTIPKPLAFRLYGNGLAICGNQ